MTTYPYKEEIEREAYMLWEKAGKPEGRDLEFWEKAKIDHKNKQPRVGWYAYETIYFPQYKYMTDKELALLSLETSVKKMRKEF